MSKPDLLQASPLLPAALEKITRRFTVHSWWNAPDPEAMIDAIGGRVKAIALSGTTPGARPVTAALMQRLPALEIVAHFGVGYDTIDAGWAGRNRVLVTNTPDVLTEEVADTTIGLLIATLREFFRAERYLRAGRWAQDGPYPLSRGSLRGRRVGILGLGRIGRAVAARLEPFGVTVAYHGRRRQEGVPYRYYASLMEMAEAVDTLIVIAPATAETRNIVNADILKALGPEGVLINIARGALVDEEALIAALRNRTILAAGLDVYAAEPHVPEALRELENVTLLPHIGSASEHTRGLMGQLMVDNLTAWLDGKPPLTPVAETPWPAAARTAADRA